MRAPQTLAIAESIARTFDALPVLREQVSELLYNEVGSTSDGEWRNLVINLRRDLYNLRVPPDPQLSSLSGRLAPATQAAVASLVAKSARLDALRADAKAAHASELQSARESFHTLVRDPEFLKGLLASSRPLFNQLSRYLSAGPELGRKAEKIERGLLRYYTRMVCKATPFATFCSVIAGEFCDDPVSQSGAITFRGSLSDHCRMVRINKKLFGVIVEHLKARPEVRRSWPVELNSTLRPEDDRLFLLTAVRGTEVFQRLKFTPALEVIINHLQQGATRTFGDLLQSLSTDSRVDANPDEAETYVAGLVELGFLHFHTGIREQEPDWDVPFREFLADVRDEQAQLVVSLLDRLCHDAHRYTNADVAERLRILSGAEAAVEETLAAMETSTRPQGNTIFYEDVTSSSVAQLHLSDSVQRAVSSLQRWIELTSRLAWPKPEQATMRHFFEEYYGDERDVSLTRFYEDFYREHFKNHTAQQDKHRTGILEREGSSYNVLNPFDVPYITELRQALARLTAEIRRLWRQDPGAEALNLTPPQVNALIGEAGDATPMACSVGTFLVFDPGLDGVAFPRFILHRASYSVGYGKYFSRFIDLLPQHLGTAVRSCNERLTDDLVAEISANSHFNGNLHPRLLEWEISYPTSESGTAGEQVAIAEVIVNPDPASPHALRLQHAKTRRWISPVDLGVLNPRFRPDLFRLLLRFSPPVDFILPLPDTYTERGPEPDEMEREPGILARPRITFDERIVLARRRWTVPSELFPQSELGEDPSDFFLRVHAWRLKHGIPEVVYLRIQPFPNSPVTRAKGEAEKTARATLGRSALGDNAAPPGQTFSRDFHKPQYIDFANPLLVAMFGRIAGPLTRFQAVLEEALPQRGLASGGNNRYVTELIFQFYYPEGIHPDLTGPEVTLSPGGD